MLSVFAKDVCSAGMMFAWIESNSVIDIRYPMNEAGSYTRLRMFVVEIDQSTMIEIKITEHVDIFVVKKEKTK